MEDWLEQFSRANFTRSAETAHDLKTPLNVAVLNLELLRMRLKKLAEGAEDPKVGTYAAAIEVELRRMGKIFDAFFLLSTPPKSGETPAEVDFVPIVREAAEAAGFDTDGLVSATVVCHEPRIRQAVRLFFEGASRIYQLDSARSTISRDQARLNVTISGNVADMDSEMTRIFKFYYTDPQGNPDLSFATARLIAETYGGEVVASEERDKVWTLRFSLPSGE